VWAILMGFSFVLCFGGLFLMAASIQKLISFRAELHRMRIADELDEADHGPGRVVASNRSGIDDLREADMLLSTAEGTFTHALKRTWWGLVGLGNPERQEAELAGACRELLEANEAVKQAAMKLPAFEAAGIDDVPLFHDPVRHLAAQGRWGAFTFFSLMPRFFRGAYGFRRVRAQLVPLLAATRELQDQVGSYRKTHEPAPERRSSLRSRVESARGLRVHAAA